MLVDKIVTKLKKRAREIIMLFLPEVLTFDQVDELANFISLEIIDDENQAIQYAKNHHIVYTQVDGDTDRIYLRGLHLINRTGMYLIVL